MNNRLTEANKRYVESKKINESKAMKFIQSMIKDKAMKREDAETFQELLAFGANDVMFFVEDMSPRSKFEVTLNGQLKIKMGGKTMSFYVDGAYYVTVGYNEITEGSILPNGYYGFFLDNGLRIAINVLN